MINLVYHLLIEYAMLVLISVPIFITHTRTHNKRTQNHNWMLNKYDWRQTNREYEYNRLTKSLYCTKRMWNIEPKTT